MSGDLKAASQVLRKDVESWSMRFAEHDYRRHRVLKFLEAVEEHECGTSKLIDERDVARGKATEFRELLEIWSSGGHPQEATELALVDSEIGDLARAAAAQRAPHAEGCDALSGNRCSCGLVP